MGNVSTKFDSRNSRHQVLPQGWSLEPIRSFAAIGTGAKDTQDRSSSGRYPFFVRSQNVERIDSWSFDGEAILTAGDGVGTGKVFHYINGKFDYHQRVYRISNFRHDVLGKYFFYQFSRNFLARIEALTAKSSVDSVRLETIAGMEIALPPRPEQKRIVDAIDHADAAVTTIGKLIAKKQAIKQGMMQQLLTGQTRLPGFTEPWERKPFFSAASIKSGQVDPRDPRYSGLMLFAPDHIEPGTGRLVKSAAADEQGAISGKYLVAEGDVVYSKIRPHLQKAVKSPISALCSADMYSLTPMLDVDGSFLLHTLLSERFTAFAVSVSARSGIPKMNRSELGQCRLLLPPFSEQRAIAHALDDADEVIVELERRLAKAKAVKQGMMQELLTGRTRLPMGELTGD